MDDLGEQLQPQETGQLAETKHVLIQALSEPDPVYNMQGNRVLKEGWLDGTKELLKKPSDPEADTVWAPSYTDAAVGMNEQRAFLGAYLNHLGSPLKYDYLPDLAGDRTKIPSVPEDQITNPREASLVWVTNEKGERKYLASKTKIDGVQILFDGSVINSAYADTPRTIRPILVVTTK